MVTSHRMGSRFSLAVGISLLAGCQALPSTMHLHAPAAVRQAMPATHLPVPGRREILQAPVGESSQGFAELNLTDEQKRQLGAVLSDSQSDAQPSQPAEIQRVLLAPQVDSAALKAVLTPDEASDTATINQMVALRKLLAPHQRQKLIQRMKQDPPSKAHTLGGARQIPDALKQRLGLSPKQEKALAVMNEALETYHRATQAIMLAATEDFMNTGNVHAFRQASLKHARTMPIDAMVAFYASLSQSQRHLMFGKQQQ